MLKLVYEVIGHKGKPPWEYSHGTILTTEKPDDVNAPCGYIEDGVFKPFGLGDNKEVYLNPFTNRWE